MKLHREGVRDRIVRARTIRGVIAFCIFFWVGVGLLIPVINDFSQPTEATQ